MDSRTIITIILSTLGGFAINLIYIAVFKFLFTDVYDRTLRMHGLAGLKLRMSIAILAINIPGMINGVLTPTFSSDEFILNSICASSSFFAFIMLFRNFPKSPSKQQKN